MNDKERRIQEQRTSDAIKANLMGPSGKFGCIVRNLGSKIESNDSCFYDWNPLPDFDALDGGEYPWIEEWGDQTTRTIGFIYDGMSDGNRLEIKYLDDESSLTVQFHGVTVYKEVAGELMGYAPRPEWEQIVDRLYTRAYAREERHRKIEVKEDKNKVKRLAEEFISYLEKKWGI